MSNHFDTAKEGVFKHYKGGLYRYLGRVIQEADGGEMALYRSMDAPYTLYVRPESEFFGKVVVDGEEFERFRRGK